MNELREKKQKKEKESGKKQTGPAYRGRSSSVNVLLAKTTASANIKQMPRPARKYVQRGFQTFPLKNLSAQLSVYIFILLLSFESPFILLFYYFLQVFLISL